MSIYATYLPTYRSTYLPIYLNMSLTIQNCTKALFSFKGLTGILTLPPASILFSFFSHSDRQNILFHNQGTHIMLRLLRLDKLPLYSQSVHRFTEPLRICPSVLQISGSSTSQSPPLVSLVVRGYQADTLIFSNTTKLSLCGKTVSTSIQTDRSHYQPGDTVRIRSASVQTDYSPYGGRVDISIRVGLSQVSSCVRH